MMKYVFRIAMIIVGTVIAGLAILGLSGTLEKIANGHPVLKGVIGVLGVLGSILIFVLWFGMIYDWGVNQFSSKDQKFFWFLILTVCNVVGAMIYYLAVYERRRSRNLPP